MLEIFPCSQNTDEWLSLRRGIVTASEISAVLARGRTKGEPSVTRQRYMMRLAAERLGAAPAPSFSNVHTERGHALEAEARSLYAFVADEEPELVGFIRNGDKGCSPDALISTNGLCEIKTKLPEIQAELLLKDEIPPEHIPQIQGQLWIAEREFVDFVSYWPGLKPFIKRAYRDEIYIKRIETAVAVFNEELALTVDQIRSRAEPSRLKQKLTKSLELLNPLAAG